MQEYQVKFETLTIGHTEFYIRSLRDRQQYYDPDGVAERANIPPAMWSLFGLVWPAGLFLAETMTTFPCNGKRILEIGCGLGLASLVLHRRGADITSTDRHPLAETFLEENLALNDLSPLPFHIGSWEESDLELERFDLIIGSDLLYEVEHPALLAAFIDRHASDEVEVIIVDPGRGHHSGLNREMAGLGYRHETAWAQQQDVREQLTKGRLLNYRRGVQ